MITEIELEALKDTYATKYGLIINWYYCYQRGYRIEAIASDGTDMLDIRSHDEELIKTMLDKFGEVTS